MTRPYALIVGEVLIDLIEGLDTDGSVLYRPRFGGSPLNVAVGVARLEVETEFVGAFGEDVFGRRLREFLRSEGIAVEASFEAGMGTVLAVAMSEAGHVRYEYFGDFASMTQIHSVDPGLATKAAVIHAGSTVFNTDPSYSAAVDAFARPEPFRTMDPNPRPFLIDDLPAYRSKLQFAMESVDLVKLSGDDLAYLHPGTPLEAAARKVRGRGSATVIVTRAEEDTLVLVDDEVIAVAVPSLQPVDANGAGDSFMAYVIAAIVRDGRPGGVEAWSELTRTANTAAALTCAAVGGATAMPTWQQVEARLAGDD